MHIRKRRGSNCLAALASLSIFLLTACSSIASPALSRSEPAPAPVAFDSSLDEEVSELQAVMRHDLIRSTERLVMQEGVLLHVSSNEVVATIKPEIQAAPFEITVARLFSLSTELPMPVVGLSTADISDSYGQPRDGGRRSHRGIDLFAPKGTPVVAVADGYLSYIGEHGKGGKCIWLVSDNGFSFYYAHLERWEPGIYEGMKVQNGSLLGYVGSTGNAAGKSPHLHFAVVRDDEALNPYPLLVGIPRERPDPVLTGGFAGGQDK